MTQPQARRAALQEVEQKHAIADENLQSAHAIRTELHARQRGGDVTLTAREVLEAETEVQHWTAIADALAHQVTMAERRLLPDRPELAQAVAFALGDMGFGVNAEALEEVPNRVSGEMQPRIYVTQHGMHTDQGGGALSGRVTIHQRAPEYVSIREPRDIDRQLRRAGVVVPADLFHAAPSMDLPVEIACAYPEFPVITAEPSDGFKTGIDRMIREASYLHSAGEEAIEAVENNGKILSLSEAEGWRICTAEVSVNVSNHRGAFGSLATMQDAQDAAVRQVSGLLGRVVHGLGRIEKATFSNVEPKPASLTGKVWRTVYITIETRSVLTK